jgi:C-terminal processing protease CtpA/Prc
MGARLLAAFKMWGTLRAFHAYGDLRDENVEDALQRFIPRVEAATDAYSYASAMLEYATTLNDAQAVMTSPTLVQHLGAASAPFATRWIEGRAVVTQVAADEAGRATGLSVGDEISAADGFPMAAYINEHRRYGAASNEWTQYRNTTALIPRGVPGEGLYRVRDASNRERTVNIPRSATYLNRFPESERIGQSVIRELTGGVGYLDLDRASEAQVDSAFQTLGSSRALILDARGRGRTNTSGTMSRALQEVLRKLATQSDVAIDRQTIRVAGEPCAPLNSRGGSISCAIERRQFEDLVSSDTSHRYKGRVVILIDERTQGAMEQFGLGAESVANPVFIGSPSAGAAGAITSMNLPGQINLTFSGSDLRHADGRQLQRVGLTPQVEVAPTVKGVRAGTDEVLERAQQWLAQQLDPAAPKRKR